MSSEENSTSKILHNQPVHVGIIMDGNGRWAKLRGKKKNIWARGWCNQS